VLEYTQLWQCSTTTVILHLPGNYQLYTKKHSTDCYSGVKPKLFMLSQHEQQSLTSGQNLWRKHIDHIKNTSISVFPLITTLDVQFIKSLRIKYVHNLQVAYNIKFYLTELIHPHKT
jgi:hypothetical protein